VLSVSLNTYYQAVEKTTFYLLERFMPLFHLAFPVTHLDDSITFYTRFFDCTMGRRSERWVDFNFFGHQLSLHLRDTDSSEPEHTTPVDGDIIRVPHFGVILKQAQWQRLHQALHDAEVTFLLEPKIRFKDKAGEQGTFFIKDPSGNTLEFKYFNRSEDIFATD
jgi:extradiol dioxygenase family protein